jgi:F-type H+-transporting ATPase subunit gamma
MSFAAENLKKEDPCVLIGTSLYHMMQEEGYHLLNEGPISSDKLDFSLLRETITTAVNQYLDGKVGKVQLLYTRFINTMTFRPDLDQLLPCTIEEQELKKDDSHVETLFEPDAETILNQLIPMMVTDVAYSDWMESTTAEQGSRRMAMKTATDNANDLSDQLNLAYNKARQAAITQEITEIVGGSEAV